MRYFSNKSPRREKRERWLEAINQLRKNKEAKIICPNCCQEILNIIELTFETSPGYKEIHMICPNCQAREILSIRLAKQV